MKKIKNFLFFSLCYRILSDERHLLECKSRWDHHRREKKTILLFFLSFIFSSKKKSKKKENEYSLLLVIVIQMAPFIPRMTSCSRKTSQEKDTLSFRIRVHDDSDFSKPLNRSLLAPQSDATRNEKRQVENDHHHDDLPSKYKSSIIWIDFSIRIYKVLCEGKKIWISSPLFSSSFSLCTRTKEENLRKLDEKRSKKRKGRRKKRKEKIGEFQ